MSGPIHDKGMLILQNYLTGLFTHIAPLALSASIVFEQEYSTSKGIPLPALSFFVLLSSLAEAPLKQSIAVIGALNQYGEVLDHKIIEAVEKGLFAIYTMEHVMQGLELLTGCSAGMTEQSRTTGYSPDTVLGYAQRALLVFRRVCQLIQHPKTEHRRLPSRAEK